MEEAEAAAGEAAAAVAAGAAEAAAGCRASRGFCWGWPWGASFLNSSPH